MQDFDFNGLLAGHKRIYRDFPLPVLLCDTAFEVYWSNPAARSLYPRFASGEGFSRAISLFETDKVLERLLRDGSCRLEGAVAFSDVVLHISPVFSDEELAGVAVMFLSAHAVPEADDVLRATQAPVSLERSIRGSVEEMFASMDSAAVKADMAGAGWIKPSLGRVSLSAYQILRVAANISAFTSCQNQEPLLSLQAVDVFGMIAELCPSIRAFSENAGIPLSIDIPSEVAVVLVDPARFQLALFNILHNSLYFTRKGNEISITCKKQGRRVILSITDKGPGIPEEILPHVCRAYYSYTLAGKPAGAGLGLALAKILFEAHGGTLSVASAEGIGTTVTVTLPETTLSQPVRLSQGVDARDIASRFSPVHVGLSDAVLSPHNPLFSE